MKLSSKYFNSTATLNKKWIPYAISRTQSWTIYKDRAQILTDMWVMGNIEPPLFIINAAWTWINPYLVYKFFWEKWLPPEFIMDIIEEKMVETNPKFLASDYWYEWCDFWLETFMKWDINKIRENFIINPK